MSVEGAGYLTDLEKGTQDILVEMHCPLIITLRALNILCLHPYATITRISGIIAFINQRYRCCYDCLGVDHESLMAQDLGTRLSQSLGLTADPSIPQGDLTQRLYYLCCLNAGDKNKCGCTNFCVKGMAIFAALVAIIFIVVAFAEGRVLVLDRAVGVRDCVVLVC